jgi:hypothetical protein
MILWVLITAGGPVLDHHRVALGLAVIAAGVLWTAHAVRFDRNEAYRRRVLLQRLHWIRRISLSSQLRRMSDEEWLEREERRPGAAMLRYAAAPVGLLTVLIGVGVFIQALLGRSP